MSRMKNNAQHSMQGVFVFVLLGLFAVMSTLMVLLGAQMYRGTVDHTAENNAARVLSAYVRSMVRSGDEAGKVSVENYDGIQAVALRQDYYGVEYVTWLYLYEGNVCELFGREEYGFDPMVGDPITPVTSFEPTLADGLLTVAIVDETGEARTVQVALRTAQGES